MEASPRFTGSPVCFKIIVVGDPAVGKSTIIHQYLQEEYLIDSESTIGYEYKFKTFFNIYPYKVRIQIWDVPGSENLKWLSKLFIKDINACIVVCDLNDPESVRNALKWKDMIKKLLLPRDERDVAFVLVANKTDICTKTEREEQIEFVFKEISKINNFRREFRVSAKDNSQINEIFTFIMQFLTEKLEIEKGQKLKTIQKRENAVEK